MRRLLAAALLVLALVPPVAPAQAAEPFLKDAPADTTFTSGVPGVPPSPSTVAGQSESVDLVALDVDETDETLSFVLHVGKLEGNPGGDYEIRFAWRDVEYYVLARFQSTPFGESSFAYLYAQPEEEDFSDRVAPLAFVVDKAAATLAVEVPKVFLLDGKERAPGLGDTLTDLRVEARGGVFRFRGFGQGQDYPAGFADAMPDDGKGLPFTFQLGDLAQGGLALVTEDRVRVSNGGSTTFVYRAMLRNEGAREQEVQLTLTQMPESWNGSVQSPVKVPAGGERPITILTSVPFEHTHGGHDSFVVQAQARDDANARATLRLGVLHTPIPQPAGHHQELYLHALNGQSGALGQALGAAFSFTYGFMNTESTHDGEAEGITPNEYGGDTRGWGIPLSPALRMGLDFDLDRIGTLVGAVKGGANGEATLEAKLYLYSMDGEGDVDTVVLAEGKSGKVTLDMQKATPFTLDLAPTPDADYVPYAKDQNLYLDVQMASDAMYLGGFGPTEPLLLAKDFKLTLPLNEYHDRLTGEADVQEGLALVADGLVEKVGRPGTVMTYAFDLKNTGRDVTIDLDVAGGDARLGVTVPGGSFDLPAGESKRVTLAVQIPGDAATGEELEVLLFAHAQEDPSLTAIVRTLTRVSTGANATDDESDLLLAARDAEADTPGFAAPLALVALAGLALALRRRA